MFNKKRVILGSLLMATMMTTIGCNKNDANIEQSQPNNNQVTQKEENVTYGKIKSINNNELILSIGTMNISNKPMGERPNMSGNGERPEMPNMPENGERPAMPDFSNGEFPQMPQDGERPEMPENGEMPEMPQGGMGNREIISLTGEEKTIVVDSNISITTKSFDKENNAQTTKEISLSDLKVDDVLKVKYKEDGVTVEYIELVSMPNKPSFNKNENKDV
ncbi:MAG: hypothetical protein IJ086_11170 [Clostridium sp.]|nr:hypothetical protein [Clostridium sp.]